MDTGTSPFVDHRDPAIVAQFSQQHLDISPTRRTNHMEMQRSGQGRRRFLMKAAGLAATPVVAGPAGCHH